MVPLQTLIYCHLMKPHPLFCLTFLIDHLLKFAYKFFQSTCFSTWFFVWSLSDPWPVLVLKTLMQGMFLEPKTRCFRASDSHCSWMYLTTRIGFFFQMYCKPLVGAILMFFSSRMCFERTLKRGKSEICRWISYISTMLVVITYR